ncbi:MAG: RNA polymerase sigma factor [Sandaracinaceae bacterium]
MTAPAHTPLLRLVGGPDRGASVDREETDDAELVVRARSGDRWAEEALYRRHAPKVLNSAVHLLGRHADADDVVQDAFVTAFERLDTLREPGAFRGWVCRIAVNLILHRLRRRKILRMLALDGGTDDATFTLLASEGSRPDLRAELAELDRVLARLPTEQRVVWTLHRVEGWSLRETAELVDASTATVKRRLAAAASAIEVHRTGRGWTT